MVDLICVLMLTSCLGNGEPVEPESATAPPEAVATWRAQIEERGRDSLPRGLRAAPENPVRPDPAR